ncbi:MAG: hypothetical protein GWN00_27740, partial [Aliifodinibius sp.]|nr:hypothetical protein [Fodinibius sp.]NIY28460.1 hypothetical protein [Fodinibius sp.]
MTETASETPVEDEMLEEIQAVEAEVLKDDIAELETSEEEVDIETIAKQFFAEESEPEAEIAGTSDATEEVETADL